MKAKPKVLAFPPPSTEPGPVVVIAVGDKRIALRWEVEILPAAAAADVVTIKKHER